MPALRAAWSMVAFHAWTARVVPIFCGKSCVLPVAGLPIQASGSRSVLNPPQDGSVAQVNGGLDSDEFRESGDAAQCVCRCSMGAAARFPSVVVAKAAR